MWLFYKDNTINITCCMHNNLTGADLDFWKGGTTRFVITADVGICTSSYSVWRTHMPTLESLGYTPHKIREATSSEIESEGI